MGKNEIAFVCAVHPRALLGCSLSRNKRFLTLASSSTAVIIKENFSPPPNHSDAFLNHLSCTSCSLSKRAKHICSNPDGRTFLLKWVTSATHTSPCHKLPSVSFKPTLRMGEGKERQRPLKMSCFSKVVPQNAYTLFLHNAGTPILMLGKKCIRDWFTQPNTTGEYKLRNQNDSSTDPLFPNYMNFGKFCNWGQPEPQFLISKMAIMGKTMC